MDVVPWLQLGGLGIVGLVLFFLIRIIAGGEWIPRKVQESIERQYDARLAEMAERIVQAERVAAEWRAAHETSEHTRELVNHQNRDLLDALREQRNFLDALRNAAVLAVARFGGGGEEGTGSGEARVPDGSGPRAGGARGDRRDP